VKEGIILKYFLLLSLSLLVCFHVSCTGSAKTVATGTTAPAANPPARTDKAVPAGKAVDVGANYRVGIGDVILVSVWKDESLTRQVSVLPDGTISFPLIGQVHVAGMTMKQLKTDLTKRLKKYIPDVVISVQALQLNSQVVYVIGKVNRPGRFELFGDINVLQALAMAGGLNPFAKSGNIKIFRETAKGTKIIRFDYDDVAKGKRLEQNLKLKRGDVIVVP
jgi:polysaccharide export outer membrane protein